MWEDGGLGGIGAEERKGLEGLFKERPFLYKEGVRVLNDRQLRVLWEILGYCCKKKSFTS